jgi:hypothetical protein
MKKRALFDVKYMIASSEQSSEMKVANIGMI